MQQYAEWSACSIKFTMLKSATQRKFNSSNTARLIKNLSSILTRKLIC